MDQKYVFISYVRNNKKLVQRLCDDLTKHGVKVWLDRDDINPGVDWQQAIRRAIQDGAFFIACFSKQYNERKKTYMNEELALAIDELRQRSNDQPWFIPIKLNRCEIPDMEIRAGKTLQDIQYIELYNDWDGEIKRILEVIQPNFETSGKVTNHQLQTNQRMIDESFKAGLMVGKTGHSPENINNVKVYTNQDGETEVQWDEI